MLVGQGAIQDRDFAAVRQIAHRPVGEDRIGAAFHCQGDPFRQVGDARNPVFRQVAVDQSRAVRVVADHDQDPLQNIGGRRRGG